MARHTSQTEGEAEREAERALPAEPPLLEYEVPPVPPLPLGSPLLTLPLHEQMPWPVAVIAGPAGIVVGAILVWKGVDFFCYALTDAPPYDRRSDMVMSALLTVIGLVVFFFSAKWLWTIGGVIRERRQRR